MIPLVVRSIICPLLIVSSVRRMTGFFRRRAMDAHKKIATSFLELIAAGKIAEAYERHVARDFRHHNPFFRGDAQSLRRAMEENASKNPNKLLTVQRSIEEGDLVAVHSHVKQHAGDRGAAVVHIFRFSAGRILELWDIGQPVPEQSPNEHGMF